MWKHENVFGLVVEWVCCWAGGEHNNQPSTGVAKVMDFRDKRDRRAAGKGRGKGTAAGNKTIDNLRTDLAAAAAKTITMMAINRGRVTQQPPPCHDECASMSGASSG
jgi:hypothetical protein